MRTAAREQAAAVWTARYEPPQFGRKRCPDLQIAGECEALGMTEQTTVAVCMRVRACVHVWNGYYISFSAIMVLIIS
jgi:hypothetical protein